MLTDKKLQKESLSQLRLLVADLKNSKKERKLQTENFLIYVKNVSSDFSADLDYYHKLCNENTQHNELLQSQQLELYNKSKSVLSSCVDKVSARRCVFSNAGDLNICLDKVKQSLNSRSEVFDQVLDLENQRESSLEDFESLLEFEESVDDTPVVDNLLFKEIAQENMNGYSETCELEDSLMHLKEKLIQQIKSTYETVITQVMDVKKETLNFESNFENMRSSNNMEMSDLSQEFESYILTILERLKVANDIVDEVVGPTGNSVATHLSKHIEDSERCIANSSKAYIDQKRDLNKIFQDVQNNMLEEHVVAEDFSKGVIDFSQSSIDYNLIVSQITDQLQSIIDNTNAKVEEVQHAGDTPTRPHRKVPHNLKELTPKEKTLHRFRERQELTEAADEDASKDPTGAMSEAED
ncbi:hypothetical protein FQR65_LT12379 [Abscondita terminalis]|nr:hypothetical protein FQR65_LT12379 [Abscondita terminalis]